MVSGKLAQPPLSNYVNNLRRRVCQQRYCLQHAIASVERSHTKNDHHPLQVATQINARLEVAPTSRLATQVHCPSSHTLLIGLTPNIVELMLNCGATD